MNNGRRKRLEKIREKIENLMIDLEEIANEEQEAFDNLPYAIAESDRGQWMQEAAESLSEATDYLFSACGSIEHAMEK